MSLISDSRINQLVEQSISRCIAEGAANNTTGHTAHSQLSLSFNDMKCLARLIEEQADAIGLPIVFSLVDPHGLQKYYFSQPDALLISHDLAFRKAYSAVALRMPTHLLADLVTPGADLYSLQQSDNICCVGGGFPCWHNGRVVAGIGVSGGTVAQDMAIAINALAQFSQAHFSLTPQLQPVLP